MSTDGDLIHRLSHPSFEKNKIYVVELNKPLSVFDKKKIERGLSLSDGISELDLKGGGKKWTVTMHEGRNRQIRRTFSELNYEVTYLHRIKFDNFEIKNLESGHWILLENMT
jgi:23S rRNA pseudouridine2605 synthase